MRLSVIVCTYNRAQAIIPCLDSITASLAHAAPIEAEIIVVDNASTDNTSEAVREWAKSCAFPVQLLSEPRPGKCRACNRAIRAAHGELLAFTDDDCRLSPEYVADLLRHDAADAEPVLRGGRVELGDSADVQFSTRTELTSKRWSKKLNSAKHENLGNCIGAGNMAMRRAVVEKLGLFDERFGPGTSIFAAEDTDLVFRAYIIGITVEYVPDMVIFHFHGRKTASAGNRSMRQYMIGKGAAYAKHFFREPDLCRPASWDFKRGIREWIEGKNHLMPELDFSFKDITIYSALGAFKFLLVAMKKPY